MKKSASSVESSFFVIEQLISLLDESFSYHILIEGSLINTQVLIGS